MMKMLMDEFYTLKDAALEAKDYERAQFFDQAISYANNTHGMNPEQTVEHVSKALSSVPSFSGADEIARKDALEITQVFSELLNERKEATS